MERPSGEDEETYPKFNIFKKKAGTHLHLDLNIPNLLEFMHKVIISGVHSPTHQQISP